MFSRLKGTVTTCIFCFVLAALFLCQSRCVQTAEKLRPGENRWGDKWAAWALGKDGDSRGLSLVLAVDRKSYVPGERIQYTVTYTNNGKKAIRLGRPSYRDQSGHLMFFLKNDSKWFARNPGGLMSDKNTPVVLQPGKHLSISGELRTAVTPLDHDGKLPNESGLRPVQYQLFVRYRDEFSPKKQVAKSDRVTFTVAPLAMKKLCSAYCVKTHRQQENGKPPTTVHTRRHYSILHARKEGLLFYHSRGFGTVRLGTIKDAETGSLVVDNKDNAHVLWKKQEGVYVHAVLTGGFPGRPTQNTISGVKRASLSETRDGVVTVQTETPPPPDKSS